MQVIGLNLFLPILLILLALAWVAGTRAGKLKKHLQAACNLGAIVLLLWGLGAFIKGLLVHKPGDEAIEKLAVATGKAANQDLIRETQPLQQATALSRVHVFLDFSGSVKATDIQNRVAMLGKMLKQAGEVNYHYFGTCVGGVISEAELADVALIDSLKNEVCDEGNGKKLKADTDMKALMQYTLELLAESADARTLCLYITDDIQSPALASRQEGEDLLPEFDRYAQSGVMFQLIRLPGKNTRDLFISQYLAPAFHLDAVDNPDELQQRIGRILRDRFAASDLRPLRKEGEDAGYNAKMGFALPKMNARVSGPLFLPVTLTNGYKSLPIICIPDSLVSPVWKAKFTDAQGNRSSLWTGADSMLELELPLNGESLVGPPLLNRAGETTATLYYRLVYPGSGLMQAAGLYDTVRYAYTRLTDAPFSGQWSSVHTVKAQLNYKVPMPWWLYIIYGLIFGAAGLFIRRSLRPTMLGMRVVVHDTLEDSDYNELIKNSDHYLFSDSIGREMFAFKAVKVVCNPLNLLQQPDDRVMLNSAIPFHFKGKPGKSYQKATLPKKRVVEAGTYRVGIM